MTKMPVLFVGHGSPMNAIEENAFTKGWAEIAAKIPKPDAILCVSAHWTTEGSKVCDDPQPKMVYDTMPVVFSATASAARLLPYCRVELTPFGNSPQITSLFLYGQS